MFDIITIGSATRDVFLMSSDFRLVPSKKFSTGVGECFSFGSKTEISHIFFDTGGGATNAAVTFEHLGFSTGVLARVGDDLSGAEVKRVLKKHHVQTSLIATSRHEGTAYSTILLTQGGERTVLVYRGASSHIPTREILWKRLRSEWMYVTSLNGDVPLMRRLWTHMKKHRIRCAWNPGGRELAHGLRVLRPFLQTVSVLVLNREEAALLSGEKDVQKSMEALRRIVPSDAIIAVTDGRRGAYLHKEGKTLFAPAISAKRVNTTGAGDAFGSALTAGVMHRLAIDDAFRLALLNSGNVVQKMGAKEGLLMKMPSKKVLQKIRIKS